MVPSVDIPPNFSEIAFNTNKHHPGYSVCSLHVQRWMGLISLKPQLNQISDELLCYSHYGYCLKCKDEKTQVQGR